MNPATELAPQLKQLRLSGILDSLDARNRQAIDAKLAYTEFLALLIQDEIARREQKKFGTRLRRAAFRATKTLEGFEFDRLPSTNRALVQDLATGRYIDARAPGLIVGPGDPTDRFGYWPARFALAGAEPVLVPDEPDARVQVIDVDDLAAFIVAIGRAGFTGAVNTMGDSVPLGEVLRLAREASGHTGDLVAASPEALLAHGVGYWAGPRTLPQCLPAEATGFATRSNATYRLLGGALRPLDETIARTLDDERSRGLDRARAAGLIRGEEIELIAALRA